MNISQEKVWLNRKTNFFYIQRGIDRTPPGALVEIVQCNQGISTTAGTLKGTISFGLRNSNGQMIAYSKDTDDLILFALEHDWSMHNEIFETLQNDKYNKTKS